MGARGVTRLSSRDELRLVEGVASLVGGGLELIDAYRALAADPSSYARRVRSVAAAVARGLEQGLALRAAVAASATRLDPVHAAMLGVTDATGDARSSFDRARRFLATKKRLREETTGALLYPALVAGLALAGSIALVVVVIPAAHRLLAPLAGSDTGILELISRGRVATTAVSAALAAVAVAIAALVGSRGGTRSMPRLDRLRLRLPLLGPYELVADLFACTSALAGTTRVGIPLVEALGVAAACASNTVVSERLLAAAASIARGGLVGEELARAMAGLPEGAYPFLLCGSGSDVSETADTVAGRLATRVELTARRLGVILEPALIVVVGAAIVVLVVTLVAPLFRLYAELLP